MSTATKTTRIRKHFLGLKGQPKCGRHLSRPEQPPEGTVICGNHSTMQITEDPQEVTCRHCLRVMGLLPAFTPFHDPSDAELDLDLEEEDE